MRVFRKALEERLLTALQEQVIRQEAVEYVLDNFETEFLKAVDNLGGELEQMRRRREELEREIVNLTNFVAEGECSPASKITALVLGWFENSVVRSDSRGFGVAGSFLPCACVSIVW